MPARTDPGFRRERRPTTIHISQIARNLIIAALIACVVLICWAVPVVVVVSLGGFALALVLSFPAELFARFVPRGFAILISFVIMIVTLLVVLLFLVPLLAEQMGALIRALPDLIGNLERTFIAALEILEREGLLPSTPEEVAARIGEEITAGFSVIIDNFLGRTAGLVSGTFSFVLALFGIAFVAASLLANTRGFKAAYLRQVPHRYRRDAQELWNTLSHTLSRYIGGLAFIMAVQGTVTAVALFLIGIPYPLALGAWTAITAIIPYFGAWLGAVPAVLLAFSISPTAVALTVVVYLAIQQLEGNILTPRIQGQSLHLPSVAVFLAAIVGGALGGVLGTLITVPTLAVARVLFDFFSVRLSVEGAGTS